METHIINRQIDIVSSYITYLENCNKYIDVLNASRLKEKIEQIKKVYRYASEPRQKGYLRTCDISITQLEFSDTRPACRFVIEEVLSDLHNYLNDLKKGLSMVDRTVTVSY